MSLFSRPCFGEHGIGNLDSVCEEASARRRQVNGHCTKITWGFDRKRARINFRCGDNGDTIDGSPTV